ncbi:conserved membrane protein of unknown function [Tenacibaculum sp. 190130A14a]|uniref:Transport permease protein n=1 Tax=Tenacibaculum polynesiense TaxID=3137857 RepID=A0ABM9PB49_9FLAO
MNQQNTLSIHAIFKLFLFDLKSNYKNSRFKYLWDFAPNIATALVWILIFDIGFLKIDNTIDNYAIYVLQGLFLWQFVIDIINKPAIKTSQYITVLKNNPRNVLTTFGIAFFESLYLLVGKLIILLVVLIFSGSFSFESFIMACIFCIPLIIFSTILSYLLLPFLLSSKDIFGGQKMFFNLLFYLSGIVFPIPANFESYMVINPFYQFINLSKTYLNTNINTNYSLCFLYIASSVFAYIILKNKYMSINQKITEIL